MMRRCQPPRAVSGAFICFDAGAWLVTAVPVSATRELDKLAEHRGAGKRRKRATAGEHPTRCKLTGNLLLLVGLHLKDAHFHQVGGFARELRRLDCQTTMLAASRRRPARRRSGSGQLARWCEPLQLRCCSFEVSRNAEGAPRGPLRGEVSAGGAASSRRIALKSRQTESNCALPA